MHRNWWWCFVFTACGAAQLEVADGPPDWEHFRAGTLQESTGEFIVDGDALVPDEAALRAFYEGQVANRTGATEQALIVLTSQGVPVKWGPREARALTYCVSTAFGRYRQDAVDALRVATSAWEHAANVNFRYLPGEDARCTRSNPHVVFNVEPVDVHGAYLARSFFPDTPRASRNVKVDVSALTRREPPWLEGVFRHELGHVLGFRHEHTRPQAGACFEDNHWAALTPYDRQSVMHYPQCHGGANRELQLTALDVAGARKLYPP